MLSSEGNSINTAVQGGVTASIVLYFQQAITIMVPFLLLMLVLITVDLFFGIEAAKARKKREPGAPSVRASTAIRKTFNKTVEYLCWVVLAASLSITFSVEWINHVTLFVVIANEMLSVVDNYFYVHGKKISGLWEFLAKAIGAKMGVDTSDIKIEEIDGDIPEKNSEA